MGSLIQTGSHHQGEHMGVDEPDAAPIMGPPQLRRTSDHQHDKQHHDGQHKEDNQDDNTTTKSKNPRPLSISSVSSSSSSSSSCSSLTRNSPLGSTDTKRAYLASIESLNDNNFDSDDDAVDHHHHHHHHRGSAVVTTKRLSATHSSLRNTSSTASTSSSSVHRAYWSSQLARLRQTRQASVSRNNSSISSDSGTHHPRQNSMSSLDDSTACLATEGHIGVRRVSIDSAGSHTTPGQSFELQTYSKNYNRFSASRSSGEYSSRSSFTAKRVSKLHPSPSSVSSHSTSSSLFRDDGFEDDHISSASDRLSACVPYSNDEDEYQSCEDDNDEDDDDEVKKDRIRMLTQRESEHHVKSAKSRATLDSKTSTDETVVNIIPGMPTKTPGYWDPNLSLTERVITEIIETEASYVADLGQIVTGYIDFLRDAVTTNPSTGNSSTSNSSSQLSDGASQIIIGNQSIDRLFSNIEQIYKFNSELSFKLEACYSNPGELGRCFVDQASGFDVYTEYCTMYPEIVSTLTELMGHRQSAELLKERQTSLGQSLPLGSYLLKPVQRILKYHLLLQNLIKYTAEDETVSEESRQLVVEALAVMTNIASHINAMKKRHEHAVRVQEIQSILLGWDGPDLTTLGDLHMDGIFKLYNGGKTRHLFLFDKVLLITKKKSEGSLTYKGHIMCSNLMLIESIEGQPLLFSTVPFDNPRASHTFQARSLDQKRECCIHLKDVILKSYKVQIPSHVRQILMDLTHASIPAGSKKKVPGTQQSKVLPGISHKPSLAAPDYIERFRLMHERRKKRNSEDLGNNHRSIT